MIARHTIRVAVFTLCVSVCWLAPAATLSPGDILVADSGGSTGGVFKVDPITGDRTIVSGFGVGSGPSFGTPFGIMIAPSRNILVTDILGDSIFRVNPTTGDRTRISGPGVGAGPAFGGPLGLALGPGNSLIVTMSYSHNTMGVDIGDVYRVDLGTGNRTILSSSFLSIGTGPGLFRPVGVGLDANGELLVIDAPGVLKIDPLNGNRSLVSGGVVGAGPQFNISLGVALEENGDILVADLGPGAIFRIDPITGDRTFASGGGIGSGPAMIEPYGVARSADGTIFAMDQRTSALFSIDPNTGDRTIVSEPGVGLGPDFNTPAFITIVPVPEPSAVLLCITGVLLLAITHKRTLFESRK